ncbi:MAG: chemotaxis protein CheW [Rhodospirillales bacterium]
MYTAALTIDSHIVFDTGGGIYALQRSSVLGVTPPLRIDPYPFRIRHVMGHVQWNGDNIVVLSIHEMRGLSRPSIDLQTPTHLIILSQPNQGLAFSGWPVESVPGGSVFDLAPRDRDRAESDAIVGTIGFSDQLAEVLDVRYLVPRSMRADVLNILSRTRRTHASEILNDVVPRSDGRPV